MWYDLLQQANNKMLHAIRTVFAKYYLCITIIVAII